MEEKDYRFNGVLYLVRNKWYSTQYLGSGKSLQDAIDDMEETIKKHNLKSREKQYY